MLNHRIILLLCTGLMVWSSVCAAQTNALTEQSVAPLVIELQVDGAISPATDDFIVRGIENAEAQSAELIVLQLNTPGGLDSSMRNIIRKILASSVPIATFVSPPGSRAASAGTYITYASHIAAMAPATNLGSATPVSLSPGGSGDRPKPDHQKEQDTPESETENTNDTSPNLITQSERKVINDAAAYIKGLAKLRGRNEEWAEQAVRDAVNLTAEDALAQNVIDVIANDVSDLLTKIDGRVVKLQVGEVTLSTKNAIINKIEPDWRSQLLAVITNPNIAYVLILLGMYGLFFEMSNPGSIFPGVLGGISLLLALYAFQVLPVNYAGLALILLGIAFMVSEMFVTSFGVLGIGGAVAFVFGSLILMDTEIPTYQISLPLIIAVTVVTGLFTGTLIKLAISQRKVPVSTGSEQMVGAEGTVIADSNHDGNILIHGETWAAHSTEPLLKNQRVRVRSIEGLVLHVEPVKENT